MMRSPLQFWVRLGLAAAVVAAAVPAAQAGEHVVLKNGFEVDCVRRETVGDKVRLYLAGTDNYLEVAPDSVVRVEMVPDAPVAAARPVTATVVPAVAESKLTHEEMHTMLSHAGTEHNIDEDLLASLVKAESDGQVRAVSRTGARGLMQLMPKTATDLGVKDAFAPEQNIAGGTAYLDQLLTRYHDNVVLAVAAYNAGPGAVDHYHGIPPYHETQVYVARVIREFNRRKKAAHGAAAQMAQAGHPAVAHAAQAR
ncbi:MAG: lytic transglycosylase domain-containing protein [Edaphobacter sp.]|uniref:lytic transglycosylase domain-containing protein n=1 Tax=Edaphobacter sp. TaxID=1934404 RepID=UPI00238F0839|nr:lytic transglycosylase domain-containing protein [Edaphobacter sp.]MDE1177896.1 lytic transglycosylase domain-containing protein [Edaphobacter sp.]